ncbi:MAG: histidinol-phosphatase HisJ family protein [Actinomycetota bacterium]|nr:histidinol-phosphatase HisJ family protein [Actinomycetota bacterium]
MTLVPDYHIHTDMCGHACGSVEEMVEAALEKGFAEIGIADHLPCIYVDDPALSMSTSEIESYVEEVLRSREKHKGEITVRLGIEADYHEQTMGERVKMLESYPFDYVIGSVHALGDWTFDDPRQLKRFDGLDIDQFYRQYFECVLEMVETGLYDVIAHPDLAKKFGHRPSFDLAPLYRRILQEAKKRGMCYEVNTSGLRWPVGEMYPEARFVRIAHEVGVPAVLGSDAHAPDDIGKDFDKALELLREAGYTEVAMLGKGERGFIPLCEALTS